MNHYTIGDISITVLEGDITEQDVDAIVNAANNDLQHAGGLAAVIARRGGPEIQHESNRIGRIEVGQAAITSGGKLKARHVLHAASMRLGGQATKANVQSSVEHCLRLAAENGDRSVAIPAVGAGIARLPMRECAEAMVAALNSSLAVANHATDVRFVLFGERDFDEFDRWFSATLQS